MSESSQPTLQEMLADHRLIESAVKRAVRQALLEHARAGRAVPIARDGKLVWLQPDEILRLVASHEDGQTST